VVIGVLGVVVGVVVVLVVVVVELLAGVPLVSQPDPTAVVMGPDSMYTPLKYQSSAPGVLTMRRTPTCQSLELVEVEAAMFWTTLVNGAEPVDAQSPTVPAENY
jgi:hypothetical protein